MMVTAGLASGLSPLSHKQGNVGSNPTPAPNVGRSSVGRVPLRGEGESCGFDSRSANQFDIDL